MRQEIGLGRAETIERLEIYWPTTDRTQQFHDVAVDRLIEIREDQDDYQTIALETFALVGGGKTRDNAQTMAVGPVAGSDEVKTDTEDEYIASLQRIVTADPSDVHARRGLARALRDAGRNTEALEHYEKAAELDLGGRSLLDLGLAYTAVSRLADADETYRRLLSRAPTHAVALYNMADLAFMRGKFDASIALYRKAIAAKPDYMLAIFYLAQVLEHTGRYQEAYRTYEQVLKLEPGNSRELQLYDDALYQIASMDIKMGAPQRAAQMLASLVQVNPDHPSANYALGQALLQLGRPEEAERAFDAHMRVLAKTKQRGPVASVEGRPAQADTDE